MREAIENIIETLEERITQTNQSMFSYRLDKNIEGEALSRGKEAAYQSVRYLLQQLLDTAPANAEQFGRPDADHKEVQR